MSQPVRVVTTKDVGTWPKGAELEFESVSVAEKILGEGTFKVTANADQTPYAAPQREKPADATKDEKKGDET